MLFAALLVAGCAGNVRQSDAEYVVQQYDTLYSIAWRNNLDYREFARWNGIGADYRIRVGQRLRLTPPAETPAPPPVGTPAPSGGPVQWNWPTDRHGQPVPSRSGGLLFVGQPGQQVRAAARGRVVYTGSGIRGYGQLIIIKHSDTWLSAYGYNDNVRVREGQDVSGGEPIATMGRGPHEAAALYFEIRNNGRTTDAEVLLPGAK